MPLPRNSSFRRGRAPELPSSSLRIGPESVSRASPLTSRAAVNPRYPPCTGCWRLRAMSRAYVSNNATPPETGAPERRWIPLTAARAATGIRSAVRRGDPSEALRWVAQLVADIERAPAVRRAALIRRAPPSTGDRRWDAMLAGAVEYVCHRFGLEIPPWSADPDRFLDRAWFVIETILGRPSPGLAVSAFCASPASLANRGVFVHLSSLESV